MDKLLNRTRATVDAVKEKVPFLDGNSEPESGVDESDEHPDRYIWSEKANRFRDVENGRFVSREKALGRVAVGQMIGPPVPQGMNGSGSTQNKSGNKQTTPPVGNNDPSGNQQSASSVGNQNVIFGPKLEDLDLEAFWSNPGNKEKIATEIMTADPALYLRYVAARDGFIISEANARGAGLSDPAQKKSLLGRLRSKLPERFRKAEQQTQAQPEEFGPIYGEALKAVLAGYSNLSPEEQYERRLELEADAGYALEYDISKKKMEASGEKKFSLSRKVAMLGGFGVAAVAGAGTGVWERIQKGEHDLKFLGMAAVFGAAAGYGASKMYQPQEDQSTIDSNAEAAEQAVRSEYEKNSLDSLKERRVGLEGAQTVTKREKRKALGRTALGVFGGAAAGAGGHLFVDTVWPILSGIGTEKISEGPTVTGPGADPVVELNPLDSDNNGVVNDVDMPDRNEDGVITIDDSFDPLDTNRDGLVNDQDMPDTNGDGVVDINDTVEPETFNPLDTNRDGLVNGRDMPDTNGDSIINHDDQTEVYDTRDTNHDGAVNAKDMPDINNDGVIDHEDQAEVYNPLDTNRDHVVDGQDIPDTNNDDIIDIQDLPEEEAVEEVVAVEQGPAEDPVRGIYVEPGSSITNEWYQHIYHTYGLDLDQSQLDMMYVDLIESGNYTPEQIFNEVDFYPLENGRWGMEDVGSAELTGVGQNAIDNWLIDNNLMKIAA